jgi:hypothetical protein
VRLAEAQPRALKVGATVLRVRFLGITANLGPGASPARLEALVRGVRVATDVGHDAELKRLRRTVTEQMKYPTDAELSEAAERLAPGAEESPRHRAQRHLAARRQLREEVRGGPPDWWFDYFFRLRRDKFNNQRDSPLVTAGYERLLQSGPLPILTSTVGLDVLDPILYQALVSDALARFTPGAVGVSELRYENPFFQRLFGKGMAEKTISSTAQVIDTVGTIGSTRKMAKADASVAEGTVGHRIEASEVDVELKRVALERERQALLADRIANARSLERLNVDRIQRAVVEAAIQAGQLDIADAIQELDGSDAAALGELGLQYLELEEKYQDDDPGGTESA